MISRAEAGAGWGRGGLAILALGIASGCSVLSLDVLQGGTGEGTGGGANVASSASAVTTSSASGSVASGSSASATSTSGGGDGGARGDGGAGGASSSSTGDGGGGSAATATASQSATTVGSGGACADSCLGDTSALCDSFDDGSDLGDWEILRGYEEASTFELVEDPTVSCPGAAKIFFSGPSGNDGGWAEIYRSLPGSPEDVSFDVQVWRETAQPGVAEGVLEIAWERENVNCLLQVLISDEPAAQAFINEYDAEGDGTELGDIYLDLLDSATTDAWLHLGVDVSLGDRARITLRSGSLERSIVLDDLPTTECGDGPPDPDSWHMAIGAPYNEAPITLYYDDYRVTTR